MEDRTTKLQWRKSDMAKDDYVTPANSITDALAPDYVKFLQEALDCDLNKCDNVQRSLEFVEYGAFRLSFTFLLRILSSTRVAKYTFELDPVPITRIQELKSKLRDQQEELERLRSAGRALPFARFETLKKTQIRENYCGTHSNRTFFTLLMVK